LFLIIEGIKSFVKVNSYFKWGCCLVFGHPNLIENFVLEQLVRRRANSWVDLQHLFEDAKEGIIGVREPVPETLPLRFTQLKEFQGQSFTFLAQKAEVNIDIDVWVSSHYFY
jgi:hypothetical protein